MSKFLSCKFNIVRTLIVTAIAAPIFLAAFIYTVYGVMVTENLIVNDPALLFT